MVNEHTTRYRDELLPLYLLDLLEGERRAEVERHLATGCAECEAALAELHRDLEQVALSQPPVEVSPEVRSEVLRAVEAEPRPQRATREPAGPAAPAELGARAPVGEDRAGERRRDRGSRRGRGLLLPLAATLAAVALLVSLWSVYTLVGVSAELDEVRADREGLARQVERLDEELRGTRTELARLGSTLSVLAAPGSRSVVLAGLPAAPRAGGTTIVLEEAGRAVFTAWNLPQLPEGKTYQLWAIDEGTPVSAGVFEVDPGGSATVPVADAERIPDPAGVDAWAVTVEPSGGVPQPTGDMVLQG